MPANPVTDWQGPQYLFGGEKEKTVVATFATDTAAMEKMSELTRTLRRIRAISAGDLITRHPTLTGSPLTNSSDGAALRNPSKMANRA